MSERKRIEIFTAGCFLCEETVKMVENIGCELCEISVLDVRKKENEERARELGIRAIPAVVVEGKLSPCCTSGGPDPETIKKLCAGG